MASTRFVETCYRHNRSFNSDGPGCMECKKERGATQTLTPTPVRMSHTERVAFIKEKIRQLNQDLIEINNEGLRFDLVVETGDKVGMPAQIKLRSIWLPL